MPRPERPVDPAAGAVEQFAVHLRKLREQADGMTYRRLADRSGYSVSTLSEAAAGRRLPTLDVALAYVLACGGDEQEWTARWHAAAVSATRLRSAHRPDDPGRPPYRGLHSFGCEDADLFFGRDRQITDVVDRVVTHQVTMVVGPSGAGKTSLLAAGVVPAMRDRDPSQRPVIITPGERPWTQLLEHLPGHTGMAGKATVEDALGALPEDTALLVVVDQFEELYTLCEPAERTEFIDGVLALANRPDRRFRLVLSVRADFYGRCAEHPGLIDVLRCNQVLVGPMGPEELREAVSRPAATVGLSVERALLATVVNEAKGRAGVLPLLAHAMLETWRRRRGPVLTMAGFNSAGGISAAIAQTAEAAYDELDTAGRRLSANLLLRLQTVDEDVLAARRRVDLAELLDVDPDADRVINQLAEARLITVDRDTVEIAHEAVLTAWPRLRQWIDDDRDALRAHRKLTEAARLWADSERDPSTLATGMRLEVMRAQADAVSDTLRLSPLEREFVEESTAAARRAELAASRRAKRLRVLTAAAVAGALVAGGLAAVAGKARTDALNARDTALSRQTALTADSLRGTDPALAAQLAIAGYEIAPTSEARSALLESSAAPMPARYLGGAGPTALDASASGDLIAVSDATDGTVRLLTGSGDRLRRSGVIPSSHPDATVYAVALSPDGTVLAVGDTEATITLWDITDPRTPTRLTVPIHARSGPIERLDIDPTGRQLAAAGAEGVLRWHIADPTAPRELATLPAAATTLTVTYDTSGGLLAFGTSVGEVQLWDVSPTPTRLAVLPTGGRSVPAVSFSPDGHTLVAGSHDRTIQVWDISSPVAPKPATSLTDLFELKITTTAFSPDGDYLIAGSSDSTVRVIDTSTWRVLRTLPHPDVVTWATFTDDGQTVVTVTTDGAVRTWPLSPATVHHAAAPIFDTPFAADGERLAVFAENSAAVWDTSDPGSPTLLATGLTGPPTGAPFSGAGDLSDDGTLLAAGTTGGEVHLLDVTDPTHPVQLARLGGSQEEVVAVAFNPDGTTLTAGGRDMAVRVWDLADRDRPRLSTVFDAPRDVVTDLEWNPSGSHLAVASADSTTYLVNAADPRQYTQLDGMDSYVYSATFNPAGDLLAIGGVDRTVLLWDVSDPAKPRRIGQPTTGPSGRILELSFHPHKDLLAASVIDGATWLWDITDPERPTRTAVLSATDSPQNTAVFRPTGDLLATGGGDQRLRTWRTDEHAVATDICASSGDPITAREWRTYLPDLPYDPPCRPDGTPAAAQP